MGSGRERKGVRENMVALRQRARRRHRVVSSQLPLLISTRSFLSTGCLFQCRQHGKHAVKTRQPRTAVLNHLHHPRIMESHSTCIRQPPTQSRGPSAVLLLGHDIYDSLGEYFKDAARKSLLGAPLDDSTLVPYLVPSTTPPSCSPPIVF